MDAETLNAITQLAGSLTVQAVLLFWLFSDRKHHKDEIGYERQRGNVAWDAIQEDWQRQREREISRQDVKNGGTGL